MAKTTETALRRALERLALDLRELGHAWALVGGLAVGARAEPRFTRDVDIAVAVSSDGEAEQLVHLLQRRGYRLVSMFEHLPTGRIGTVRLYTPVAKGILVDLLFAASGVEQEAVTHATPGTVMANLRMPIAQRAHLMAMKVLSADAERRPQDLIDIRALLREAKRAEVVQTERLLGLMTERGFSRQLNLVAKFHALRGTRRHGGQRS